MEIIGIKLEVILWEPRNNRLEEIKYEGWNNRTKKELSRCVSSSELLHNECLCCLCQKIYISILIMKGLISMYKYLWKI
jgi:hypothetical protein